MTPSASAISQPAGRAGARDTYEVRGVPRELEGAQALFTHKAFDFERWAVSLMNGTPNEKQVDDRGIDRRIRFHLNRDEVGDVLVSVKVGRQLNPGTVRDLHGTIEREGAEMGLLILLASPTRGMVEEAAHSGSFHYEFSGASFPRVQIVTVADPLKGPRPASRYPSAPPPCQEAHRPARSSGRDRLTLVQYEQIRRAITTAVRQRELRLGARLRRSRDLGADQAAILHAVIDALDE